MNITLANRIARECLAQFEKLPKAGKPNESFEWTILSAIVLVTVTPKPSCCDVRVVALGTGTKCLAGDELSSRGDRVHDSHAEVLARRAFVRYLLEQIENALVEKDSIFEAGQHDGRKFVLKNDHSFHFFTTHSPCGDASIFEKVDEESTQAPAKRARLGDDCAVDDTAVGCCIVPEEEGRRSAAGMTGGKLLLEPEEHVDLMAQTIGAVRTKPGRGVRTLSVSCSDKLARWNVLGLQGSLLMILLARPIYLASVVVCDGTNHSVEAIRRAICGRFERWAEEQKRHGSVSELFQQQRPAVIAANGGDVFKYRKNRLDQRKDGAKFQPSPCGIVWCDVKERPHEVEVAGRRHGVTKRQLATTAARLQISKIELYNRFARTYRRAAAAWEAANPREALHNLAPSSLPSEPGVTHPTAVVQSPKVEGIAAFAGKLSYADAKALSVEYATQWARLRDSMFGQWTVKPSNFGQFFTDAETVEQCGR